MRLSYIVLLTDDFSETVRFWRDIMEMPLLYKDDAISYAMFDTGNPGIALSIYQRQGLGALLNTPELSLPPAGGVPMYLTFPVDDVDATYARVVEQGAKPVSPPQDRPEQQSRLGHVRDFDGNLIELYSPLAS